MPARDWLHVNGSELFVGDKKPTAAYEYVTVCKNTAPAHSLAHGYSMTGDDTQRVR